MVFNPPKLSLNFRNNNNNIYYVLKTISEFMGQLSTIGNEMRKIGVFKRELPLSILLINDGSFDLICLLL